MSLDEKKEVAVIIYKDGTQEDVSVSQNVVITPTGHFDRTGKLFSEEQKIEVVTLWLATQNLAEVSRITGIPNQTIKEWKLKDWWKKYVEEIRVKDIQAKRNKVAKAAQKCIEVINEQLEKGEFFWDAKSQRLLRKPPKFADTVAGLKTMVSLQQIMDARLEDKETASDTAKHLNKLAEMFSQFTEMASDASKKIKKQTIDVEDVTELDETEEATDTEDM